MMRREVFGLLIAALAAASGHASGAAKVVKLLFVSSYGGPPPNRDNLKGLLTALAEHGYVEGRNLELQFADAWLPETEGSRDDALASAIARGPDAILVGQTDNTRAAQKATRSIPIVFWNVADPVAAGIVGSLRAPGGNTTGTTVHNLTLFPKRLQLVREALPKAKRVALLVDRTFVRDGFPATFYREMREVAKGLNLELVEVDVSTGPREADKALDVVAATRVDVVLPLGPWPSRSIIVADLVKFQRRNRIAVVGIATNSAGGVQDGLVLQYGADIQETFRLFAAQLAQIFAGRSPGEIPVQQQTRVELVVNLRVATELGLTIPNDVLKRADRVIE